VTLGERIIAIPSRLLPDPWGNLVAKELRVYTRSSRFRVLFLIGFTFGILIWLPLMLGKSNLSGGFFEQHFLTWVSLYAVLLLSEVAFWNVFGFDRAAVQAYFVMPIDLRIVLAVKNLIAVSAVLLEVLLVSAVYRLLQFKIKFWQLSEAVLMTLLFSLFFLALGNLMSVYNPRPIDPSQSWRSRAQGKSAFAMLLSYPLILGPVALSFLGRYAFGGEVGFVAVTATLAVIGGIFYWVALDSSGQRAMRERERIVDSLSSKEGPIAA
jgi:ABC-2 type transport system permease protein